MIPLLQTKTADTAHMGIFASVTRPSPRFWAGPGDKASRNHEALLVVTPIAAVVTAGTGVKKRSRSGQEAVKGSRGQGLFLVSVKWSRQLLNSVTQSRCNSGWLHQER